MSASITRLLTTPALKGSCRLLKLLPARSAAINNSDWFALNVTGSRLSQSLPSLHFPNVFYGLFNRWMCEINTIHLRNVPSVKSDLSYRGSFERVAIFRSGNISISWDVLYQDESFISAGTHMFLSKPLFQFFACREFLFYAVITHLRWLWPPPADKVQSALLVWSHPAQVVPAGSCCRPSVRWVDS